MIVSMSQRSSTFAPRKNVLSRSERRHLATQQEQHTRSDGERCHYHPDPLGVVDMDERQHTRGDEPDGDDGLQQGHELEVYRDDTYLGRVRIVTVRPDKAVAEVMKDYKRGFIQRGDRVASRLKG